MKKMCKNCLHYKICVNKHDYPVTDYTLGCDDWEKDIREKLKAYEDAEEQGLLVRVPIPIGSVYWRVVENRNRKYIQQSVMSWLNIKNIKRDFGKTVFLTREEAEQKLKEMEDGKG